MLLITFFLASALVALIYIFLTWNNDYWQKRGVDGPKPVALLGNYPSLFNQKRHTIYDMDDIYREYKKHAYFVGTFNSRSPQLLITSPELVHKIYVNDFKYFHDNELSSLVDEKSDFLFANNPFSLTGETWKERRADVSPGMTTSRIKSVYPITKRICNSMRDYIEKQVRISPKDSIDTKDLCLRFTTEVVTDCVLGLDAKSFTDKPTPIMGMIRNLFSQSFAVIIVSILIGIFPNLKNIYKMRLIPKPVEKFFIDLMQNAVDIRKSQNEDRMDYMHYILQLQEKRQMSMKSLTAHTMTFLLDGFDTTATAITHCLLLLARFPETQEKLRAEILKHVNEKNEIDFETLSEMPYLDACIHEGIRIFPPIFFSIKLCTQPIELTNKNGQTLLVEKGEVIVLPLFSIHHDEEYYDKPEEFQPERFLEENGGVKKYREKGTYLGFADGPRTCLGMRFALVQAKAAISEILINYKLRVNPKTRTDNQLDPKFFISQLEGGVYLDFETRN